MMDQVLYDAARLLDESGHFKKKYANQTADAFCIEGAIRWTMFGKTILEHEEDAQLHPHLKRVIGVIKPDWDDDDLDHDMNRSVIYDFNDHPDRTKEECVKLLMEAAEKE